MFGLFTAIASIFTTVETNKHTSQENARNREYQKAESAAMREENKAAREQASKDLAMMTEQNKATQAETNKLFEGMGETNNENKQLMNMSPGAAAYMPQTAAAGGSSVSGKPVLSASADGSKGITTADMPNLAQASNTGKAGESSSTNAAEATSTNETTGQDPAANQDTNELIKQFLQMIQEFLGLLSGKGPDGAPPVEEGKPVDASAPTPPEDNLKNREKDLQAIEDTACARKCQTNDLVESGALTEAEGKRLNKTLEDGLGKAHTELTQAEGSREGADKFGKDIKALGPQLEQFAGLKDKADEVNGEIDMRMEKGQLTKEEGAQAKADITRGLDDAKRAIFQLGETNDIHGHNITDKEILGSVSDKFDKLDLDLNKKAFPTTQATQADPVGSSEKGAISGDAAGAGPSSIAGTQQGAMIMALKF